MQGRWTIGIGAVLLCLGAMAAAQEVPAVVQAKCTGCHPVPRPTSLSRGAWPDTNRLMADLMKEAGMPFSREELEFTTEYYLRNSLAVLPSIPDDYADDTLQWSRSAIGIPPNEERPRIGSLDFTDIDGDGNEDDIVATDIALGAVTWLSLREGKWREKVLSFLSAPVGARPFDLEGDGDIDLVVSAMGDIYPSDAMTGSVHLLVNDGTGVFEKRDLVGGIARVTDCLPADFDGDGDQDIVIAKFGWRKTGGLSLLRQDENGEFEMETILDLNGCMRLCPTDSDGDGDTDFVVMVAQQHEMIALFRNDGSGRFSNEILARANHPAFGSSNIVLHDLDEDGDEDILYTNGDMMDEDPVPKPYHGIRWLENDGEGSYAIRHLANMPGCYDAELVDLDLDGDLDVVFSALYFHWDSHDFPSLAWLENKGGFQELIPRRIAYAPSNLANIAVGDVDGDGTPEIVGGGMHVPGPIGRRGRITLWQRE